MSLSFFSSSSSSLCISCFKSLLISPKSTEERFEYHEWDYLRATDGVVPDESDEICIITPGADLNSVLIPDSVKDMVLARMDRMTLNEQTVLKCSAVLGKIIFYVLFL